MEICAVFAADLWRCHRPARSPVGGQGGKRRPQVGSRDLATPPAPPPVSRVPHAYIKPTLVLNCISNRLLGSCTASWSHCRRQKVAARRDDLLMLFHVNRQASVSVHHSKRESGPHFVTLFSSETNSLNTTVPKVTRHIGRCILPMIYIYKGQSHNLFLGILGYSRVLHYGWEKKKWINVCLVGRCAGVDRARLVVWSPRVF